MPAWEQEGRRSWRDLSGLQLVVWPVVIVFLLQILLAGGPAALSTSGGIMGLLTLPMDSVWAAGAMGQQGLLERGEWWRILCPIFLHFSVLHVTMNMMCLFSLGRITEQIYGRSGLVLIFLATGLGGVLLPLAWSQVNGKTMLMAGSSGAVCGLLGILLAHMRTRQDALGQMFARSLLRWTIFLAIWSLLPQISFSSHLGGFAAGYGLARILPLQHISQLESGWRRRWVPAAAAFLAILCLASLATCALGARDRLQGITQTRAFTGSLVVVLNGSQRSSFSARNVRDTIQRAQVPLELETARQDLLAALDEPQGEIPLRVLSIYNDVRHWWRRQFPDLPWPWHRED